MEVPFAGRRGPSKGTQHTATREKQGQSLSLPWAGWRSGPWRLMWSCSPPRPSLLDALPLVFWPHILQDSWNIALRPSLHLLSHRHPALPWVAVQFHISTSHPLASLRWPGGQATAAPLLSGRHSEPYGNSHQSTSENKNLPGLPSDHAFPSFTSFTS